MRKKYTGPPGNVAHSDNARLAEEALREEKTRVTVEGFEILRESPTGYQVQRRGEEPVWLDKRHIELHTHANDLRTFDVTMPEWLARKEHWI